MNEFYIKKWGAIIASVLVFTFVASQTLVLLPKQAFAALAGNPDMKDSLITDSSVCFDGGCDAYGPSDTVDLRSFPDTPDIKDGPDVNTGGLKTFDTQESIDLANAGYPKEFDVAIGGPAKDPIDPYGDPNSWANGGPAGAQTPGGGVAGAGGTATTRARAAAARKAKAAAAAKACKPTGGVSGTGLLVQDRSLIGLTCQVQTNTKLTQTNTKISAAKNTITAKKLTTLEKKEIVLDGIAYTIIKRLVSQLVKSTVQWIRSGFKGSPMFVTNPETFLLSAADQVAGEVINGAGMNSLCSPMNVRTALDSYYRNQTGRSRGGGAQCTLTGALANAQSGLGGAGGGTFRSGNGWGNWFSAINNPVSSPLGSYIYAQNQLDTRIALRQETEKQKWDWGKGFLAKEECTTVGGQKTCKTTTPGDTIAQALNFDLSSGKRELIAADEINEVVSALLSQLTSQALSGGAGLFGLGSASQNSGYSSPYTKTQGSECSSLSYLDRIGNPKCDGVTDGTSNTSANSAGKLGPTTLVGSAVTSETQYQTMNQTVSVAATDGVIEAQTGGTCNANVIANLQTIQTMANSTITESNATTQQLLAIQAQYDLGTDISQTTAIARYNTLASGGLLHTDVYNATFQETIDSVLATITTLRGTIQNCAGGNTAFTSDPIPTTGN